MIISKKNYLFLLLFALLQCKSPDISYVFTKKTIDLGKVSSKNESVAQFDFKNVSKTEIEIKDIILDCHCIKVKYTTGKIKAGETGFITVFYDNHRTRFFEQSLNVYFESDVNPPVLLLFRGFVESS